MIRDICIKNATIHNLKGIDVTIPKNKLTVITGVSGSGKSSLAFDTLYDEGKKRYLLFSGTDFIIESSHRFDSITGLSPTVAVEQRIIRQSNPKSTVGTRVKLEAMLAALFANFGTCPDQYTGGKPLSIALFQKNSSRGMCVKCFGHGFKNDVDLEPYFKDKSKKICELIFGLGKHGSTRQLLESLCKKHGWNLFSTTLQDIGEEGEEILKYGDNGQSQFPGFYQFVSSIINRGFGRLIYLLREDNNVHAKPCPKCEGSGLGEQAMHTTFGGKKIHELESMYISDLLAFLQKQPENPLLKEIIIKLQCMVDVGLHHLSLNRSVPTLSGGEIQRLFLAGYMISQMDSIIFVFDEPTIGLHEVEKENLIKIIDKLVQGGNTVVAVEHDENFIRHADWIIDIGPNAGILGGEKIFEGTFNDFLKCKNSKTSPFLSSEIGFNIKSEYRAKSQNFLSIKGASLHNLQNVNVDIPLGIMIGIAGVSGSGKSSLITDTLVPLLKRKMKSRCIIGDEKKSNKKDEVVEPQDDFDNEDLSVAYDQVTGTTKILGTENISRCYVIDQKPIGRTRTSCPATYTGIMDKVRILFASTEEARKDSVKPGMFSLNSTGGCKKCHGNKVVQYYVGFNNFIEVDCDQCNGKGWREEALKYAIDGVTIANVLEMSVDEAAQFFKDKDKSIFNMLSILQKVGMGYIKLGQGTPTISGGESQRIKLAKELAKTTDSVKTHTTEHKNSNHKKNLYIMDEPTTGLSFYDSERLLSLMNALVDNGNTIIVTEHDPYILSNCDYLIELGPGGGNEGGLLLAQGTPQELKNNPSSIIGRYLK